MNLNSFLNIVQNFSLNTLYRWFKEDSFRLLFKNAGTLLSGNMVAWILGLVTFAITARILGATQFGILVLITTYVTIVDKLLNFQSWQALIKYGAEALVRKSNDDFKSIVKFCTLLDVATAILGTFVAVVAVSWVGQWLAWESETVLMAALYSLVILFNISGTPTGVLRLFNRFRLFAVQNIIAATIKFIGIVILLFIGVDLWSVLLLWMVTTIIGQLLLLGLGWRELYIQGFEGTHKVTIKDISTQHPGIWGFILTTNLSSSVRMTSRELDTMIVGGIVGVEGAGLFKIAKQIAAIPAMVSDPLYQAIYPDLSRLWARGSIKEFKQLILRSGLVAGGGATIIWLGTILFGSFFIQLIFGAGYVGAQSVLVCYMLAMVIAIYGFPLTPAMLSMGRPKMVFWVHLSSTVAYFPLLFIFIEWLGLVGAGVAYVCYYLLWTCIMIELERKFLREKMLVAQRDVNLVV
jgi:O-antigen/teichoic acid export membrane protein